MEAEGADGGVRVADVAEVVDVCVFLDCSCVVSRY